MLASRHSVASSWVDLELRRFAEAHGRDRVLMCRVGVPGDDAVPGAYDRCFPDLEARPLVPDLRGPWPPAAGADQRDRLHAALAIVASVAGLPSREVLLGRRARRQRLALGLLDLLVLTAVAWTTARQQWQASPYAAHEAALHALSRDAARQRLEEAPIVAGLEPLLHERRWQLFGQAARFFASDSARTAAAMMLAAHRGRCAEVTRLAATMPVGMFAVWRDATLSAAARCGDRALAAAARPVGDEPDLAQWAVALGRAGLRDAAWQELSAMPASPARDRAVAEVAIATGERFDDIVVPDECGDEADPILDVAEVVHDADLAGCLARPAVADLVRYVGTCLPRIEDTAQTSRLAAEVAAALVLIDEPAAARSYLEHLATLGAGKRAAFYIGPESLAWQGVAYLRLGERADADRTFAEARRVLFAPIEASRSWNEVTTVALALAVAGRWSAAFELADRTPDLHGRTLARLALFRRWVQLGVHRSGWARWAPTLSWLLRTG